MFERIEIESNLEVLLSVSNGEIYNHNDVYKKMVANDGWNHDRISGSDCEDWVSILQRRLASLVSDAEMDEAHITYPVNTPQTKEELYYRRIYDEHFHGMEHVVKLWEGGGRAMGAEWKSDMYTREGLKDVNLLSHALQEDAGPSIQQARAYSTSSTSRRSFSTMTAPPMAAPVQTFDEEPFSTAVASGYNDFEAMLTCGGDDRSLIKEDVRTNKYHIKPQPVDASHVFRGSCTGNPPTQRGYDAAQNLYDRLAGLEGESLASAIQDVLVSFNCKYG